MEFTRATPMNTRISPEDKISMQKNLDTLKEATLSAQKGSLFAALTTLIQKLRDPKSGCQWDKKQTYESFAPCLADEANEVLDAIQKENKENLKEELGDVLFCTFFLIQLAEEAHDFSLEDVINGVLKKLVFRHPHVFGATDRSHITAEDAFALFQEAKKIEKAQKL